MTRLTNLWPRRMANQLALLLIVALMISNMIAMVVVQFTGSLLHPVSRSFSLERLAIAYQAANRLLPADARLLLKTMNHGDARFWLSDRPEVAPFGMLPEERRLREDLISRLSAVRGDNIVMQLESADGGFARWHLFSAARKDPLRLRTSILLPDGRYLNAVQPTLQAYQWSSLLSYSLPVTSVPVLLIVLFFIRRVTQPVKTLATATEKLSRGEWVAALPLSGPYEARELTQAFNVMQERIARHIEGRTRMLAALSHDLNTPLTELRLQVELLEPGDARDDMLESLSELSAMVSETLNFIRDDAVQEQTCRHSITALLDDLARRYRTLGQPLIWQSAEQIAIRCRPLALKRALTNLIDNALFYAGDATLSLERTAVGVRIEIRDHGKGIAPALLEQVFEPFVQLDHQRKGGNNRAGAGWGLGLSIARACIHAHGGELILENRPPAGLCAIVLLPLS